jgi:hypothetical protein
MLSSVENKDILQGLIADFFKLHVPLEDIEIATPYSIETYTEALNASGGDATSVMRHIASDIRASLKFADFLSDVQVKKDKYFSPRSLLYTFQKFCDNYNSQRAMEYDIHGKAVKYSSLRPVYTLNVLEYSHYPDEDGLRIFRMYDYERGKAFDKEWVNIGFFELNKKNYETAAHKHWRELFKTGKASKDAPEYIKKAASVVDYVNLKKEERDMISREEWAEDTIQAVTQTAYEDGQERVLDMVLAGYTADQIKAALREERWQEGARHDIT